MHSQTAAIVDDCQIQEPEGVAQGLGYLPSEVRPHGDARMPKPGTQPRTKDANVDVSIRWA